MEIETPAPLTLEDRVSKLEEFSKDPPQFANLLQKIEKIENEFYKQNDQLNYLVMQKFIKTDEKFGQLETKYSKD